jgi:hypothetical protein
MRGFKTVVAFAMIAMVAVALTSCERKITRIESNLQPLSCVDCHTSSNLITGKETEWAESLHGTGTAYLRATSAAAGLAPDQVEEGEQDPTRQDCRACHMIHDTYTMQDFALRTTAPVNLFAVPGATFSGGEGNLCVNCHQPRRDFPVAENGVISGITSHWGPHHGPQSAMMLGVAGSVEGKPSTHYMVVKDTCVGCHMGGADAAIHTFEPDVATCQTCHPDATDFDIDGVQTEIETMGNQLGELLLAAGLINENSPDGHPTVTEAPEGQATALYNWLFVMHEDKSMGVHNPDYAKALLQAGLDAMKQ